jgi:GNAT superfamily N-acetyltransferase
VQGGDDVRLNIRNRCSDFNSYRAARVKSLFNAETGCNFDLVAELPIDQQEWSIGVVVGPSGSGKTSIGKAIWGGEAFASHQWPDDAPIIDAVAPNGDFDAVTAAIASVGLGDVPSWLRPYAVLSNGEKFRADMARIICEQPSKVVIDEFTSVVDRQIARFGALAFAKAWRRTSGQAVLLSCHYDILDWIEPDWIFNTETKTFHGRWLPGGRHDGRPGWYKRPKFELEIWQTDWRYWPEFEPHHYLKMPKMIAAKCYVGTVGGERVCHMAISTANKGGSVEARGCRLVVLPEWQGAGVGLRFLNAVCEMQAMGSAGARLPGKRVTTIFHTSHPGLCAALRRLPQWRQVSAKLHGTNKRNSSQTMIKSGGRSRGRTTVSKTTSGADLIAAGFGGHFRAVQGFRYYGEQAVAK